MKRLDILFEKLLNFKKQVTAKSVGSATVVNVGIIGATFILFTGVLAFGMLSMANAKLTTAIQNAAIAGAMYYKLTGWEPCEVVKDTLNINQVQFISCRVLDNKNIEVEASRIAIGPLESIAKISKYARAGQSLTCAVF